MIAKKEVKKKKMGRPLSYKPEYCQRIVEYFDIEPYREVETNYTYKNGDTVTKTELRANDLRFFSGFARSIGVVQPTLQSWRETYPDFSVAFKKAKELQEEHLITNGLQDTFAQAFAIFTAKNILGWRDKTEVEHSGNLTLQGIMSHVDDAAAKNHGRLEKISHN